MEDILQAIALGIVQGLTEFLPISSSGHLIVARELFGWDFSDDLTFDVALHLGTTLAVLVFFWREWLLMLRNGRWTSSSEGFSEHVRSIYNHRFLMLLALGSAPAAVVGYLLNDYVEDEVRSPIVVGAMLLAFAAVLYATERFGRGYRDLSGSRWSDALLIGCAQAISLVPGVSRSGVTIATALWRGFTRQEAARFSFLLATPVIVGAGLLKLTEAAVDGIPRSDIAVILVGAASAAIVGWLAIHYLLLMLQRQGYMLFVVYRVLAGAFILVYFAFWD
jgi:undecaprenyl-diphosphatase